MTMEETLDQEQLRRLEGIAFHAWPAETVVEHRGMLLRSTTGRESRRANSAAVYACDPGMTTGEIIDVGERFYRARGQPVLFQIGPTAPAGIDSLLVERGYSVETPVDIRTASPAAIASRAGTPPPGVRIEVSDQPGPAWIEVEITRGRYAGIASTFLRLMGGLRPRAAFATVHVDRAVAAACLLVLDHDVVVLAAMRTLSEHRRRGAARAILHASARWAAERASLMYLQVEEDNAAAIALYSSEGFVRRYGYYYRAAP
jgi:GNAT superfamily N-acetyltransferase